MFLSLPQSHFSPRFTCVFLCLCRCCFCCVPTRRTRTDLCQTEMASVKLSISTCGLPLSKPHTHTHTHTALLFFWLKRRIVPCLIVHPFSVHDSCTSCQSFYFKGSSSSPKYPPPSFYLKPSLSWLGSLKTLQITKEGSSFCQPKVRPQSSLPQYCCLPKADNSGFSTWTDQTQLDASGYTDESLSNNEVNSCSAVCVPSGCLCRFNGHAC